MAEKAEVKLGYDGAAIKSGAAETAAAMRKSLSDVADTLKKMSVAGASTDRELKQVFDNLKKGFSDAATSVQASSNKTSESLGALQKNLLRLGAAAAGAWLGHQMIASIYQMDDAVEKLQRVMGGSSESATQMALALRLAGSSADEYVQTVLAVGRGIRTQSAEFDRLGVKIKAANGDLLPTDEILKNVYKRMLDFKEGADQTMFALSLTGRSAKDFGDMMENLARVQTRATEMQKQFGLEMGPEHQAQIKAYKTDVAAMGIALDALALGIGAKVMPALQALMAYFADIGPTAIKVIVAAITALVAALSVVVMSFRAVGLTAMWLIGNFWDLARAIVDGPTAALDKASARAKQYVAEMSKLVDDEQKRQALLAGGPPGIDAGGFHRSGIALRAPEGKERFTVKPPKTHAHDDRMAEWEADLKAQRDAYERMKLEQGSFERWSEEQTARYWKTILDGLDVADKKRAAVSSKYYDAERAVRKEAFDARIAELEKEKIAVKYDFDERIRLARQQAILIAQAYGAGSKEAITAEARVTQEVERQTEQRIRLYEIEAQQRRASAEHVIDMARLAAQQDVALRRVSAEQAFQIEENLENRLFAIRDRALREQRALERDPVKIAQINAQIEGLELEHQSKLTEIANRAEQERLQTTLQAVQATQDAFSGLLQGLMSNIRNWRDAFKSAIASLTSSLNRLAADQIAKQFLGPGTGGNNFLSGIFGKIFGGGAVGTPGINPNGGGLGGAAGSTAEAAASTAVTTAKTAEAAASTAVTAASTAQVATATAFELALTAMTTAATSAAAALTAVATSSAAKAGGSLLGSLFDAVPGLAVGTPYVPQDTLAVVHKGEAVIPAKYNKGGAGGGMSINQQFHINGPVDTRTQYQIAEQAARGARIASLRAGG